MITLDALKEAYEAQDFRYEASISNNKIYLKQNNGRNTITYGYLEWHPERDSSVQLKGTVLHQVSTVEWYALHQNRKTVGAKHIYSMLRAMKELGVTSQTIYYISGQFEKTLINNPNSNNDLPF